MSDPLFAPLHARIAGESDECRNHRCTFPDAYCVCARQARAVIELLHERAEAPKKVVRIPHRGTVS